MLSNPLATNKEGTRQKETNNSTEAVKLMADTTKTITIRDLVTSQEVEIDVEDQHVLSEIIRLARREFGLPPGRRLLMRKDVVLNPNQTVGAAGLSDGDWLILAPNPVGGAFLPRSTWELRLSNEIRMIREVDFYRISVFDHGSPMEERTITVYLQGAPAYKIDSSSGVPALSRTHTISITLERGFPESPPDVHFTTSIFHPNIYLRKEVCIAMLNNWEPSYTIVELIKAIEMLLWSPNLNSPANGAAVSFYREHPILRQERPCDVRPIRVRRLPPSEPKVVNTQRPPRVKPRSQR